VPVDVDGDERTASRPAVPSSLLCAKGERGAIELERARIASELDDVVTHNVSVMMVQAGAARKVLGSPREDAAGLAEEALLAVEASGRTAMGELRNLLSLLAPQAGPGADDGSGDAALTPQPGLADVSALVERVSAVGLPVELRSSLLPGGLPPCFANTVCEG
jgi:histidine kinase